MVNCCPGMENDTDGVPGAADGGAKNVGDKNVGDKKKGCKHNLTL